MTFYHGSASLYYIIIFGCRNCAAIRLSSKEEKSTENKARARSCDHIWKWPIATSEHTSSKGSQELANGCINKVQSLGKDDIGGAARAISSNR